MAAEDTALAFPFRSAAQIGVPAEFSELRDQAPISQVVLPTGDSAWLVTRYADIRQMLADQRFSRAAAERPGAPRVGYTSPGPRTILGMDPPDHTRLRKLVANAFTPRRVEALRESTEKLAAGLMFAVSAAPRPVDLIGCYTLQLPIKVIFSLLGVPQDKGDVLHAWSDVIFGISKTGEEVNRARQHIEGYLSELIAERRREAADDLLSVLIAARDDEDKLSEEELVNFALILLTAGHMSTASTLASALLTLLCNPGHADLLREDPDRIPAAVEELLRYNPLALTGAQLRVATEDAELGGITIRAGEGVIAALASANYDESIFTDPNDLRFDRSANPHLAFGYGIHHCLGAQLARMELQVAIRSLLTHLPPTLHLAVPQEWLTITTGLAGRSVTTLPVDW